MTPFIPNCLYAVIISILVVRASTYECWKPHSSGHHTSEAGVKLCHRKQQLWLTDLTRYRSVHSLYSQFSPTELLMTLTDEIAYLNARLTPCFNCFLVYQTGRGGNSIFKQVLKQSQLQLFRLISQQNFGYLLCARYVVRDQKYYHEEVKVLGLCQVGDRPLTYLLGNHNTKEQNS